MSSAFKNVIDAEPKTELLSDMEDPALFPIINCIIFKFKELIKCRINDT